VHDAARSTNVRFEWEVMVAKIMARDANRNIVDTTRNCGSIAILTSETKLLVCQLL
jgi:hypothetical protein